MPRRDGEETEQDQRLGPKVVVLGVGNLLRRDEGVGVRVVLELEARHLLPESVAVVDGGTAGFRLVPLLKDAERIVLVDAMDVGAPPGTVLECSPEDLEGPALDASLHEVGPMELLAELESATGRSIPTVVVGVQPADLSPWDDTLSDTVAAALPGAVDRVVGVLARYGIAAPRRDPRPEVAPMATS